MFKRTLSKLAQDSLAILGKSKLLNEAYLAGGSALALHLGHRYSLDFDFFTPKHFDSENFAEQLKKIGDFQKTQLLDDTILGVFNTVKFSLFHYNYPLIANLHEFQGIKIADLREIAAMKLEAIVGRGNKRDFIDLYFLTQKYSLEEIFNFYD